MDGQEILKVQRPVRHGALDANSLRRPYDSKTSGLTSGTSFGAAP